METNWTVPFIIEKDGNTERVKDVWSKLLESRIIFLGTGINDTVANAVVAQLLVLAADDPAADIHMYINSPGGSVSAGLAIYDTMNYIAPDVSTICIGAASSMGAFLLSAGAKGKRRATENARVMIHQVLSGASGQVTDLEIQVAEARRYKELLTAIIAKNCGKPYEKVYADCERDNFMNAEQALEYGLIDTIERSKNRE